MVRGASRPIRRPLRGTDPKAKVCVAIGSLRQPDRVRADVLPEPTDRGVTFELARPITESFHLLFFLLGVSGKPALQEEDRFGGEGNPSGSIEEEFAGP
jgi:hypothetical protein